MTRINRHFAWRFIAFVLLTTICVCLFGINWGWVDDILRGHIVFGTFSSPDYYINQFGDMPLQAQVSMYPQRWFTNINIHGVGFITFTIISGLVLWFSALKDNTFWKNVILGIIILLLMSSTLHELTFTRIVFLLLFAGTMVLLNVKSNYLLTTLGIGLVGMAAIQRFEVVLYAIPLLLLAVFISSFADWSKRKFSVLKLAGIYTLIIAASFAFRFLFEKPYYTEHRVSSAKIHYLLDANESLLQYKPDILQEMNEIEKIKYTGLVFWFFQDEKVYNTEYINKTFALVKANSLTFLQSIKAEINKVRYRYTHRNWKNWFWAFILLSVANILWALSLVVNRKLHWVQAILYVVFPLLFFMMVAGIYKLEDRVTLPLYLGYILFFMAGQTKLNKRNYRSLLFLLLPFLAERGVHMYDDNKTLNEERLVKQEFIKELEGFDAKIFVYDLWSMTLIHNKPWDIVRLDKVNQVHVVYGEAWSNVLSGHMDYLKSLTGETSFESFIDYLLNNQEDVVLVLSEYRASFLQSYLTKVYNYQLDFIPVEGDFALEKCKFSFTWAPTKYNYYQIKRN